MWTFNRIYFRESCILLVDEDGEKSAITTSAYDLIRMYNNGESECPSDNAKVIYCLIFNVKMKCKTFKDFMDMLEKIVADCC